MCLVGSGAGFGAGTVSGVGSGACLGAGIVFFVENILILKLLRIFYLALSNNPMLFGKDLFSTVFTLLFELFKILVNLKLLFIGIW